MATTDSKEIISLEKKYKNLLNDPNSDISAGASSLLILLERETKQISHHSKGGRVTAEIRRWMPHSFIWILHPCMKNLNLSNPSVNI